MMSPIAPQTTVGQLVTERPGRARVFERYEIDYCCGGKLSLSEACARHGLDPDLLIGQLRQADAEASSPHDPLVDVDAMGLSELADHIEQTHHAYLRRELPRLDEMTAKVYQAHGHAERRLRDVRRALQSLHVELSSHMLKEERILFPMIRELEASSSLPPVHCGSIANPVAQMEQEHEQAGDGLAVLREATDGFQPPDWACNTYRAMLDGLAQLERDMHQHVHKENNVLFPKAMKLEAELAETERA